MWAIVLLITLVVLLALATLLAGLAFGLSALSIDRLRRRSAAGEAEARLAYPIVVRNYETTVSLVIGLVILNAVTILAIRELLPTSSPWMIPALLIGIVLMLVFSGLLPYILLRKRGLRLTARLAPYLEGYLDLLSPLSKPIAKFVDRKMPSSTHLELDHEELLKIVADFIKDQQHQIDKNETAIIKGALTYGDLLVEDVMVPRSQIIALNEEAHINTGTLQRLQSSGHSRIPVFNGNPDNITGMIFMHDLVGQQQPDMRARDVAQKQVYYVHSLQPLAHVLDAFLKTHHQLFIVVNQFQETVGIISIEDILEKIIGRKITDEFDRYEDLRAVAGLAAKQRRQDRQRSTIR